MGIFSKILFGINLILAAMLGLSYLSVYVSPQLVWPLALLGLAYPFLLVVNVLFVIFWIVRFDLRFLLSLAMIAAGWSYTNRYIQIDAPFRKAVTIPDSPKIKLLSFNVRLFNVYLWKKDTKTFNDIFAYIEKESPDILCLQDFYTQKLGQYSEQEIFKKLKAYKYRFVKYSFQKTTVSGYGIATFSKYPIVGSGDIRFEKSFNQSVYTDLLIDKDTIRVFNNHLQSIRFRKKDYNYIDSIRVKYEQDSFEGVRNIGYRLKIAYKQRALQTDELVPIIQSSKHPVIVCGDFNDSPVSYTYQQMSRNLNDAFVESGWGTGHTYLGKFPAYRIDYVLLDKKFKILSYQCPKIDLSDHYPVLCTFAK